MKLFIGGEHIISPLGRDAGSTFDAMKAGRSGLHKVKKVGFNREDLFLSALEDDTAAKFDNLLQETLNNATETIGEEVLQSDKTLLVISSTKGDLDRGFQDTLIRSVERFQYQLMLKHAPILISNGCASGVIAINTAADYIRSGAFDNAIVIGCDVLSDFILFGFQSLFAISDSPCRPFDKDRKGINLGEACAMVILTKNKKTLKDSSIQYLDGTSSNDANHISGPSRTGEGLVRSVQKTLSFAKIKPATIDFISAHGTGTIYNDDMESIAFNRLGMNTIPLNSMKGYFGHTLGAAGVLETAATLQCMRNNWLLKSLGYKNQGTPEALNIVVEGQEKNLKTVLKTVSGFGGCNASLILQKQ